jgi:hypothetical protein
MEQRLGNGYISGALVRVDKSATLSDTVQVASGDLDACTIWFDTTCSVKKYVGNTVIVLVVL